MTQVTIDSIQKIFQNRSRVGPIPRVKCADGFSMSVQAGFGCYCSPKRPDGPYTNVEIGFPSERVESLMKYCQDSSYPTDTVYGYVPIEVVVDIINEHGGMANNGT